MSPTSRTRDRTCYAVSGVLSAMFEEYLRVDGLPKKEKQKKIIAMAKALPKRRLLDDLVGAARALT